MSDFTRQLEKNAREQLAPALDPETGTAQRIHLFKSFLSSEHERLRELHRGGAGGLEVARDRAAIFDLLLNSLIQANLPKGSKEPDFALVATGGYGRALLNPGSDIDILFLLPVDSTKIKGPLKEQVQLALYALWDLGLKIGHASRSIGECIEQARIDQENKTALMDARLITGDAKLYGNFTQRFAKDCIEKGQAAFFELRREDIKSRHDKYDQTVFLQEPNVKESCGGMRDFQTIEWVSRVKIGTSDLSELVKRKLLTADSKRELEEGYDFIHRVRNELHFHTGKGTDQLTLQLQGIVAPALKYPQPDILRSTEAFMRDYYRHTRHIFRHTTSLMEAFEIEREQEKQSGFRSFLTFRGGKEEKFDGFIAKDGRLFPENKDIFRQDSTRIMRLFQHCQVRDLKLSPPLRRLIAHHWDDIDRPFRYLKANRRIFQSILERKGEVSYILRLMHRIGVLGRYLPEFGALDCLVQHEFFHRYTADEHTLRCIDMLDHVVTSDDPTEQTFRRLMHDIADPYALYLAMILHDTGRSENVREHIDGSAMLASRLCNRMQISGARRKLIMFLVDNHLTFWRTATTRNLDDPVVIEEFCAIMKNQSNLDALFLFTYADSNATSPESWNGWKQSLMFQLHAAASAFLEKGREQYGAQLDEDRVALRGEVMATMREDYQQEVLEHFERMPDSAFHYRSARHIVTQVRTVRHFLKAEESGADEHAFCIKWIDMPNKAYTEMVIAARDRRLLLEKVCCALASEQLNILSADLFTRTDGIVVNIFRVCTTNFETVSNESTRKSFLKTLREIQNQDNFSPEKYLKRRQNFLKMRSDDGIPVPVRAYVSNDMHPTCTTVELQALDRIGLLHDLFHTINQKGLNTVHARICTEKGVAMDTLYITDAKGGKIEDEALLEQLEQRFSELISRADESVG